MGVVGSGGCMLRKGSKLMELRNKGAKQFGKLTTLVRGMFVQRRQCDLTLGDTVEDN